VSAYPVMLDGSALRAVVVGGGAVAARKVSALAEAGAAIRVVAPSIDATIERLAAGSERIRVSRVRYSPIELGDADLVIAATDDATVNAQVARDARRAGRLVTVVDAPQLGNCTTPAVHRCGELVVAVSAGRVPRAAARIRDAIARRFDARYAGAVHELAALRSSLLADGRRQQWTEAASALLTNDFCERVESEGLAARIAEWR